MNAREKLVTLLAARSVQFGEFTLSSGRRSDFYIDARLTTMSPEGLQLVGEAGLAEMDAAGWHPDAVGGLTLGADPVAYAIALASMRGVQPLRAFTVRKDPKQHGTRRQIEGPFRSGDRVVVVEDVITTGASALAAAEAIEREGGTVVGLLAVLDREEGGRAAIEARGYSIRSLSVAREVVARAKKQLS